MFSIIILLRNNFEANSVSVTVGAIALTRISGANSAPNDLVTPSTADFAAAMLAWKGIPNFAATVLKSRIEGLFPFLRAGK